jgi:hypothetical protein
MEETKTYTIKVKPNTYEYGRAGNRHTIAYETAEDLKKQIDSLIALGLWDVQE